MPYYIDRTTGEAVHLDASQSTPNHTPMWGRAEAGEAWDVSANQALRLMPRCPGYVLAIISGRAVKLVPAGADRPEKLKTGPKPAGRG